MASLSTTSSTKSPIKNGLISSRNYALEALTKRTLAHTLKTEIHIKRKENVVSYRNRLVGM